MDSANLRHALAAGSPLRRAAVRNMAIGVAQTALLLPFAYLIREVFDRTLPSRDIPGLAASAAAILGLALVNNAIGLWGRRGAVCAVKEAVGELRGRLTGGILGWPRERFTRERQGALHTSLVYDTERMDGAAHALISHFLPAATLSIGVFAVMTWLSWPLALGVLVCAPMVLLTGRVMEGGVRRRAGEYFARFERFSERTLSALRLFDVIAASGARRDEIECRKRDIEALRSAGYDLAWLQSLYSAAQNATAGLLSLLVLLAGAGAVLAGAMSLGTLVSFYVALGFFKEHLRTLTQSLPVLIAASEPLRSINAILCGSLDEPYRGNGPLPHFRRITFREVSFSYSGAPLLNRADFSLERGATTLIIGPSGSGKTTALFLMLGFYRPKSGGLFVEDTPYDDIDLKSLCARTGFAPQDPSIFPGTVAENIALGVAGIERAQVEHAARLAGADAFVRALPEGFDSYVGDDGAWLSGGQRQRLSLARAMARRPDLLVLDEPTNHLAAPVVLDILEGFRRECPDSAVVVTAHDERLLSASDAVYRLIDGVVWNARETAPQKPARYAVDDVV